MTHEPDPDLRGRARRALERSVAPVEPPPEGPSDPELLVRIEAALLTLPHRRRAIFLAVWLDGTSYVELAKQSGLSEKGVEREVARTIVHIERCLERGGPPPSRPWWRRFWRRLLRL